MSNPFNSISKSIYIFIILISFSLLIGVPLSILPTYISWFDKDIAIAAGYTIPMLATIYVVYNRVVTKEAVTGIFNFSIGGLKKYIFIIPLAIVMMIWIDLFASLLPMPDWVIELFEEAFNLSIPNIITISIIAPLLEEILVRGLVFRGYLQKYTPNKAIILSAIFFGVIHLNPWQFIAGFISGIFLGYLYYKTKSLTPSILVHFMNNTLSVVFSIYYTGADTSFVDVLGRDIYYGVVILSIFVGYILYRGLNRTLETDNYLLDRH